MILPLDKGQIVVGQTQPLDLFLYTDTDGDGVADKKELRYAGGPRGGIVEHQSSGLVWCADNWIYTTVNAWRLRWTPRGVIKEPTAANEGQWGLSQDDFGKPWPMNGRGERGPVNFQVPMPYGPFRIKGELADGFDEVWPLPGLADVQGGAGRYRASDKTLNHFTATSGADNYRGDRLPAELRGDLFFGEPVGRLVRCAEIEVNDGVTMLRNPCQCEKSEFIRSSDPCFRPVNMVTAPDGNPETRFTTGSPQVPGMWVQIELPAETSISALTLDTAASPDHCPRACAVECSLDGSNWRKSATINRGSGPMTDITLRPAMGLKTQRRKDAEKSNIGWLREG